MLHASLAIVAIAIAGLAPARAQDAPVVFSGSSAWAMDYADDSCRLTRDFSAGGETITLALERYQPGDSLYVTFASGAIERAPRQLFARLQFAPGAVRFESQFMGYELEDGRNYFAIGPVRLQAASVAADDSAQLQQAMNQRYAPADEVAAARRINSLTVINGFNKDFVLDLGSMAPPITAMQACIDQLLGEWGLDVARHRTMTRPAVPAEDPQSWVTEADYPREARNRRSTGMSSVRLMLDATGKPTSCHVRERSRADTFNQAACRILMEKGRVEPALDAAGQPMPSYYVVDFQFQLNVTVRGA